MRTSADSYLSQVNTGNTVRRGFHRIQRLLAFLVIPAVFWCLKLTGITMAGEAFCGMEEHTHGESCVLQELVCELEEVPGHSHTEECLRKVLICTLPEQEAHTHTAACGGKIQICQQEETPGHTHSEACAIWTQICTQEEKPGHTHQGDCFTEDLICPLAEVQPHSHDSGCYTQKPGCGLEESEAHIHDDACMVAELTCQLSETAGHSHGAECYTKKLICPMQEAEGHTHGSECYVRQEGYSCGQEEIPEHFHTESCYQLEEGGYTCGLEESLGHTHGSDCYITEEGYICGQEEKEGHSHSETCYRTLESCPIPEHVHEISCYSDISADLETSEDWEASMAELIHSSFPSENVVMIARSQLGVTESLRNFKVDEMGVRRGITRYGQWFGNPYGDWSSMFVSFCLDYAGLVDAPRSAGPETLRLAWEEAMLYLPAEEAEEPAEGELLFLDKDEDGAADAVAIITGREENVLFVIEGDLAEPVTQIGTVSLYDEEPEQTVPDTDTLEEQETTEPVELTAEEPVTEEPTVDETALEEPKQDMVAETLYAMEDPAILGYGWLPFDPGASVFAPQRYIWLDGTNGGLGHLTGSPNTMYTVEEGRGITLPDTWTSPSKYAYKLRGWYDVTNNRYYLPGAEMQVTGNAVLYADWVAETYDIGVFNEKVDDTVSTNSFITTHMFDYNYLFNVQSSRAQVTVNDRSHSETWSMVTSGTTPYGNNTFDFVFVENDSSGGDLCNPSNRQNHNTYHNADTVSDGVYSQQLGNILFGTDNGFDPQTGTGIMGKTYLGTGDHLFQIMDNPSDEHNGYYYYDSKRNAASYNQSNQRFYVYDYLSATSDSIGGAYADFIPLNSPYANTNGKIVGTYQYPGANNEYQGVNHYRFDSKYSTGDYNSTNNAATDYAYGMRTDIQFYLPNDPGSGGNKDLYGRDIEFEFSGDDDLWVLVDGKMALDIGGIHQGIGGIINFSTGAITVKGQAQTSLMDLGITAGDHTLTMLYLERGSSMSNCSIYFNLAPRYGMELKKEDVLTQQLLNGTEFTIYEDIQCTKEAVLWESEAAYQQDLADGVLDSSQSAFVVQNGVAKMWGFGSGNTYYIKETKPPDVAGYGISKGLIRLTIGKVGQATYNVDVIPEPEEDSETGTESGAESEEDENPSNGFTVHGVSIDEKTKTVFLTATNAPETVTETTTVQVIKKWEDNQTHGDDYIQAYLTVTDPDGTVRRIREVTLSDENEWMHIWTNLPKYDYDALTEVKYGIEESYESGYYSTVRKITEITITEKTLAEALSLKSNETYVLKHNDSYLATVSDSDAALTWVNEATAKEEVRAQWTATVTTSNNTTTVKFTNGHGQILSYNHSWSSGSRYFYATKETESVQYFRMTAMDPGFQFYARSGYSSYYMSSASNNISNGRLSVASDNNRMTLFPMKIITNTDIQQLEDWAYAITNTPLATENETSLSVKKEWNLPSGYDSTLYQEELVTVKLLANNVDTGRSVTLSLKNGWQGTFQGLPLKDSAGNVIQYTVEEVWNKPNWAITYGPIQTSTGIQTTYSTTITNTYQLGGPMLPSTGTAARILYVLCGGSIMLTSLVYGIILRRRRERRRRRAFRTR